MARSRSGSREEVALAGVTGAVAGVLVVASTYLPWFHHRGAHAIPVDLGFGSDGLPSAAGLGDGRVMVYFGIAVVALSLVVFLARGLTPLVIAVGAVVAIAGVEIGVTAGRQISAALVPGRAIGPGLVLLAVGALLTVMAGVRAASVGIRMARGSGSPGFARYEAAEFPAPATPPSRSPTWVPTHATPAGGLSAWSAPDPSGVSIRLAAGLRLVLVERRGDWARVRASNGWEGWVDARRLTGEVGAVPAP